ncbi:hypothetical protein FJQ87_00565 [Shewanella sp. SNU WT4]|uniref:hypothetical protein n=1 Tax=Shewanella sp. SNU WT4 TaxID=2590015 RepID=UPI00112BEB1D|nr:hypothetical protein [Shewanella sp. SNU WT4]QDF65370.1 hypothetical protein FJQ87_00565 [Shewanella sp. SNU WT4]
MVLQTLFTAQGCDNRLRFSSISAGCYLLLIAFGSLATITWLTLFALPLALLLQLTAIRRGRDSGIRSRAILFVLLPFLLVFMALVTAPVWLALTLVVILAAPLSVILARLPSAPAMSQQDYHWGYWSADLIVPSTAARASAERVEPVVDFNHSAPSRNAHRFESESALANSYDTERHGFDDSFDDYEADDHDANDEFDSAPVTHFNEAANTSESKHFSQVAEGSADFNQQERRARREQGSITAWLEPMLQSLQQSLQQFATQVIKLRLPVLKPWLFGIAAGALVLTVLGYWVVSSPSVVKPEVSPVETPASAVLGERVALPDGFYLQFEQGQLLLQWFGNNKQMGELWSLTTAKGDKRCSELVFNNGNSYRPLQVTIEANSMTQARFSPLDSDKIIEDVAYRGQLNLCGYQFALKGTQAALGAAPEFARVLD